MALLNILKNAAHKVGLFISNLFEQDVVVKITSLVAAVVIWFVISVSVYRTIYPIIYNVPVEVALEGTYAGGHNLQALSVSEETVTVYIEGDREQVGNLTADELAAVASAEDIIYAGRYNIPLTVRCDTGKEFNVKKIEPASVSVEFDEIITKEFPVNPELLGVSAADGYVMDERIDAVPAVVNITGPAETVNSITAVAASVKESAALTSTADFKTNGLELYSGISVIDGDKLEQLSFDKKEFTVHVPVYAKKAVSLDVRITNAPDSFDTEKFKEQLELSVTELEVAVPNESIKDVESIDIGAIDMREVTIGKEVVFSVNSFLPEGYIDWNEVGSVTVKCPSEGLVKRAVHITNIELVNEPSQFDFNIITSGVTPTLIGPAESMEQLTYIDIIAKVDLLNGFDMKEGDHKLPITFSIPAFDDVWCVGTDGALSPWATIKVTAKESDDE